MGPATSLSEREPPYHEFHLIRRAAKLQQYLTTSRNCQLSTNGSESHSQAEQKMQLTTNLMLKPHSRKLASVQQQVLKEPQETQSSFHANTSRYHTKLFAHSLLLAKERSYSMLVDAQAGLGPTCTLDDLSLGKGVMFQWSV